MQRKFKLIKKYKSHKKGLIVSSWKGFDGKSNCYKSETVGTLEDFRFSAFDAYEVEDNSEFWEEITETHRFYIDEPCKVWRRYWYDIPGSYEDAVAYMKKEVINMDLDDPYFDESKPIDDTEEYTGEPRELFNEKGEQL